jgi:hypothetical protein
MIFSIIKQRSVAGAVGRAVNRFTGGSTESDILWWPSQVASADRRVLPR